MPSLQQLPDLSNVGDLPTYLNQAAMGQIGMANQFNQLGLQQNQAALQGQGLENALAQQMNPLKVQQAQATLEGSGLANVAQGLTNRTNLANEDVTREQKRAEALAKASEADLQRLQSEAQKKLMQGAQMGDQKMVALGQKMLEGSWAEIVRRSEMQNKREVAELQGQSRQAVAGVTQAGATQREQMGIEAGKYKKGTASKSLMDNLNSAKTPGQVAEAANLLANSFAAQGDQEQAAYYTRIAVEARQRAGEDTSNRGLATPGIDVPAVADLPARARPTAVAPVGAGRQVQGPVSGLPPLSPSEQFLPGAEEDFATKIKDPVARAEALRQLDASRQAKPAAPRAQAPVAPAGRVIIYKDGKPVGSVPESQAAAAKAQGYSLQ